MRSLVRRYVTKEQRYADNQGVTEDDVNEIKQDVSSFRYELMEVLKNNGFNTSIAKEETQGAGGKKCRLKERRLMKGFNIGFVEGSIVPTVNMTFSRKPATKIFAQLGRTKQARKRRKWDNFVEATKNVRTAFSKTRSEGSGSDQESTDNQSECDISSPSSTSIVFSQDYCNTEGTRFETVPETKLVRLGRTFETFTFNPLKPKFAFQDRNTFSESRDQSIPKSTEVPDKKKTKARVSAVGPSVPHLQSKTCSFNSSSHEPLLAVSSFPLKVVTPERRLSPIPSCAESNSITPRPSLSGDLNDSLIQETQFRIPDQQPDKSKMVFTISLEETVSSTTCSYRSPASTLPGGVSNSSSWEQPLIKSDKTPNGSFGIMSSVYGIEPADKEMSIGWI